MSSLAFEPRLATHLKVVAGTSRTTMCGMWSTFMRTDRAVIMTRHRDALLQVALRRVYLRRDVKVLVSAEHDTDYAELLTELGVMPILGPPLTLARAAVRALREAPTVIVVAADGPLGPRGHAKHGAAFIAWAAGVPLFALRCGARSFVEDATWDRRVCPTPFNHIRHELSAPVMVRARGDVKPATDKMQSFLESRL